MVIFDESTVTVLMMHGGRDEVVPVENGRRLADLLPDIELVTFEAGGSHQFAVEHEEQQQTTASVPRWLS